jgi:thymidylate kinase
MSKTLIVVEGPTGAGKTTLVKLLASKYRYPVVHCGPLPIGREEGWFFEPFERATKGLILDRWVYGNSVYGNVLRNQMLVSVPFCESYALAKFDRCVTIFLTAPAETLARRIEERAKPTMEPLRDVETLRKVVRGYEEAFARCYLAKCQLTGSSAEIYRAAKEFISEQEKE